MRNKAEIDLAQEAGFSLGRLDVRPSLREIRVGGRIETVEPRVMQVLVALVRADGAVVSRDQLINCCWGGRIVGEDAINRCIAKVRKVAELDGNGSFAVETVARVGYRLAPVTPPAIMGSPAPPEDAGRDLPRALALAAVPGVPLPRRAPAARRIAWAGLVLLVGTAGALAAWQIWPRPVWSIEGFQLLVSSAAMENQPALAPNGAMLAYAAGSNQSGRNLYLRNLTQGEAARFTDSPYDEYSPAWSPKSDRIAYLRQVPGKPCTIMVKPFPAGTAHEIAQCRASETSRLSWSADGMLYFSDADGPGMVARIVRLDPVTGARRNVTTPNPQIANDREPAPSPDGKRLAFYRDQYPHSGIFVRDLERGTERRITPDGLAVWGNGWTSDGGALIVGTLLPDEPALWAYPLNGEAPRRLTFNQQELGRVAGGPDNLAAVEVYTTRNVLAGFDAHGAAMTLFSQNSDILDPDISPDGSVVFVSYGAGGVALMVKPPNGEARRIALFKQVMNPHWSPDGKRIAYATADRHSSGIGIIRADGASQSTAVTMSADAQASAPVWSADGKTVLFSANDGKGWRLWRVTADGTGTPEPVSGYGWYSVRVRGDDVYATRFDKPGIWKLGAVPQLITPDLAPEYWPDWAIKGDLLIYGDFSDSKHLRIVLHPLNGAAPHKIDVPDMRQTEAGGVLTIDPRTQTPVYIRDLSDSDIALLHLAHK